MRPTNGRHAVSLQLCISNANLKDCTCLIITGRKTDRGRRATIREAVWQNMKGGREIMGLLPGNGRIAKVSRDHHKATLAASAGGVAFLPPLLWPRQNDHYRCLKELTQRHSKISQWRGDALRRQGQQSKADLCILLAYCQRKHNPEAKKEGLRFSL